METLYRKVAFEIEAQDHNRTILIGKNANFIFNPNTRNGEELADFLSGGEEIPDTSHQLEKLEAEKKELLEMLERSIEILDVKCHKGCDNKTWKYFQNGDGEDVGIEIQNFIDKAKSLIQKHKS